MLLLLVPYDIFQKNYITILIFKKDHLILNYFKCTACFFFFTHQDNGLYKFWTFEENTTEIAFHNLCTTIF